MGGWVEAAGVGGWVEAARCRATRRRRTVCGAAVLKTRGRCRRAGVLLLRGAGALWGLNRLGPRLGGP